MEGNNYYMAEVQYIHTITKAIPCNTNDLEKAKIFATQRHNPEFAILKIGTEIHTLGFLANCICYKENGRWRDFEEKKPKINITTPGSSTIHNRKETTFS